MFVDHYAYSVAPYDVQHLTKSLERAGVDGIFFAESNRDPAVGVTLSAEHSANLTIGTGISIAFSRSPMTIAYLSHSLQEVARGRFVLGLGSQVKAHIERRFDMPWSQPARRLREYVEALHAIWDCWEGLGELRFEGDFYRFSLMPEPFKPPRLTALRPPIFLAAVGTGMARVAGAVGDGVVCHPFSGAGFARDRIAAEVAASAIEHERSPNSIALVAAVMIATGADEIALAQSVQGVREKIAFYASTPAYLPVLEHYGVEGLHAEARSMVRQGRWEELPSLVDDSVLSHFALVGDPTDIARELIEKYGAFATRAALSTDAELTEDEWSTICGVLHSYSPPPEDSPMLVQGVPMDPDGRMDGR